mmetsp:Transcript_18544/g.44580  ORF Transcript_18544/g.44580 Transcript_18544/m.44580 type:complete len:249 (+) Transcript_18544:177-923(+)
MPAPWEVLGVARNATRKEIKEAYRRLAKKYHPDVHGNSPADVKAVAEAEFKRAQAAYTQMTGRGIAFPQPFTRSNAYQDAMNDDMRRMTKKEILGYTLGIGFLSTAMAAWWSDYVYRKRLAKLSPEKTITMHRYVAQTAEWQATRSPEEMQVLVERRKQNAMQNALMEGAIGAAQAGSAAGLACILIKVTEQRSKTFQKWLQSPFVSFHARPVNLLFYTSSAALVGFYLRGAEAASPKGSRFRVDDEV